MAYDLNVRCKHCNRFIKVKALSSSEVVLTCQDRKCKKDNAIKVVMMSDYFKKPEAKHEH